MRKLSKNALLEWLKNAFKVWLMPAEKEPKRLKLHESAEKAYQQIKELIKKPEVTEKWIEEKAAELFGWVSWPYTIQDCKKFIRSVRRGE